MNARIKGQMTLVEMLFAGMVELRFADFTNYEAGMCSNGGHYSMGFDLMKKGGSIVKSYWCSSEFGTCKHCGSYVFQSSCDMHKYCSWETVTPEEVEALLDEYRINQSTCRYYEEPKKALCVAKGKVGWEYFI